MMIIAVDFDGVICEHAFPDIGRENWSIIAWLIDRKKHGNKLILWTCRDSQYLTEAIEWCKKRNLEFDAVNEDIDSVKDSDFGKGKSCKVYADVYLDDRNITPQSALLIGWLE